MEHALSAPVSFHMPGHKGAKIYRNYGYGDFLNSIMDCDITEISGADNLFQAEGIIRDTSLKYSRLYDVKKSYLLVNGTSGGIIAAILASAKQGERMIVARNCHKAVFNAMFLGDISPVYAYPDEIDSYGISGAVSTVEIERLMDENPDVRTVILPSPNYYGICSDIKTIGEVVHKRGKILIVDQAHGAHLKFMDKGPMSAEEAGADIVINSTHKTLATFTQSAVLNFNTDRVNSDLLEDKLQMIESSSPSYMLMASLDINADIMEEHGDSLFHKWQENLDIFYEKASDIKGLSIMDIPETMDRTKINLDMSALGIDGSMLEDMLMKRGIFAELVTGNIVMCMTGIGNSTGDYERLIEALSDISAQIEETKNINIDDKKTEKNKGESTRPLWNKKRTLHPLRKSAVSLDINGCSGKICASSIIPYPPGIPLICPGEIIDDEDIEYIKSLRSAGEKVIGINEDAEVQVYL